jgi:GcrA cell cycle regulator
MQFYPDQIGWTKERVELLKTLWADGLSASQIAAELCHVTRNGVIGKIHRLGLVGRSKSPASKADRPRRRRKSAATVLEPLPRMVGYEELPEPVIDNVIPNGQRRTLLELNNKTCRWPIGDPGKADFFFCGGSADNAKLQPYCSYHSRVAYQPAERRERRLVAA